MARVVRNAKNMIPCIYSSGLYSYGARREERKNHDPLRACVPYARMRADGRGGRGKRAGAHMQHMSYL